MRINSLLYLSIEKNALTDVLFHFLLDLENGLIVSSDEVEATFREEIAEQQASTHHPAPVVMKIYGPIVKHTFGGVLGTQKILQYVRYLAKQPEVSGFVFDIDSPGGMVSGTAELAHAIKSISKPTVAYTNGTMCSAAYHIASACNKIVVSPFADAVGSIGTFLHFRDYSPMFEKLGAKIYEVYAPESTEKNKAIRELMKGNDTEIQNKLSELTQNFINTVKANRGERIKDDGNLFKGAVYTPKKALEVGLCDEIASLEETLNEF